MSQVTTVSDNRRIVKNTVYLYIRMLVTLVVTLYTSRVILKTLGIDDFGIYNVVGGVVILFSFISTSLRSATQRFVSYELGLGEKGDVNKVYSVSMICHFIMAVIIILLAETIGLWFVENKLNIPTERMVAARWVYQFTILTFLANVFQAPFHAIIIAYEKMSFYAYVSIFDVALKLGVAFLILASPFDKLITYAVLLSVASIVSLLIPLIYCKLILKIGRLRIIKEKGLFGNIMGYSGWTMFNGCAVVSAQQGGNILLNIFNGVAANGAFGIANQVSTAIYGFVANFQSAFQPQIVKQYAAQENESLFKLIDRTSIFSYYLLLLIAVPFCVSTDYILTLWLGSNPEFASGFCQLLIVYFLMDALQAPLWMLIGAKGNIREYTIWSTSIIFLNIPLSWLLLHLGCSVYIVFIVRASLNFLTCIIRPFYVSRIIESFSLKQYGAVILRALIVTAVIFIPYSFLFGIIDIWHPLVRIAISFIYTIIVIITIGLKKEERTWLNQIVREKFHK